MKPDVDMIALAEARAPFGAKKRSCSNLGAICHEDLVHVADDRVRAVPKVDVHVVAEARSIRLLMDTRDPADRRKEREIFRVRRVEVEVVQGKHVVVTEAATRALRAQHRIPFREGQTKQMPRSATLRRVGSLIPFDVSPRIGPDAPACKEEKAQDHRSHHAASDETTGQKVLVNRL